MINFIGKLFGMKKQSDIQNLVEELTLMKQLAQQIDQMYKEALETKDEKMLSRAKSMSNCIKELGEVTFNNHYGHKAGHHDRKAA
jgi:hypothetical protein